MPFTLGYHYEHERLPPLAPSSEKKERIPMLLSEGPPPPQIQAVCGQRFWGISQARLTLLPILIYNVFKKAARSFAQRANRLLKDTAMNALSRD